LTKAEQRIKDFSSGIKKLSGNSQDYMHKLTHVLLLVEQLPIAPTAVEKKGKNARMSAGV